MWITSRYELDKRRKAVGGPMIITAASVVLAAISLVVVLTVVHERRSPLPATITKQVTFVVFYPSKSWQVAPSQISYQASAKVLTMTARQTHMTLTITEQAAPSQFTDIPQYYPALLDKLNQYQNFGTINGTVYLTHPTELGGGTEAILASNGTLMLVYPQQSLSEASWRQFFNELRVLH